MTTTKYEHGLTWRSILGILYVAIVMQPAVIWIWLSTGSMIYGLAMYAAVFLFGELAASAGKPLTKQEILVFLVGGGSATAGVFFAPMYIYNLYFRRHPLLASYGISQLLPDWFAPSPTSPVWSLRTFIHPDWILPVTLSLILVVLATGVDLSLGFLTREIYVVHEKLPFPMAHVSAQICSTLSERREKRMRVFTVSAALSFAYSLLLYGVPMISEALGRSFQLIPLPWFDFNNLAQLVFPGASFGIATDPSIITIGLILPYEVTISIFIGSMALYFFGNWILVSLGIFTEWRPGMNLQNAWQRSTLNIWASPIIALAVAAGFIPLVLHPKTLIESFKSLLKLPAGAGKERGTLSLKTILAIFFSGTVASVILAYVLVPGFPIWILLLLSVGWTFIINLIVAYSLGITGVALNIPYVREGTILASGYKGYDVWFAPLVFPSSQFTPGGANWCAGFKVAELTSTWPMDLVKSLFIALPTAILFGFLYTQIFWTITPIPSSLFPAPFWDINVIMTSLFITGRLALFKIDWMVATFIIGVALQCLAEFAKVPISLIGIAMGAAWPIANCTGLLVGLILAKVLGRFLGKTWVEEQRFTIIAGVAIGQGLVVAFSAGLAMILKSMWIKPF